MCDTGLMGAQITEQRGPSCDPPFSSSVTLLGSKATGQRETLRPQVAVTNRTAEQGVEVCW